MKRHVASTPIAWPTLTLSQLHTQCPRMTTTRGAPFIAGEGLKAAAILLAPQPIPMARQLTKLINEVLHDLAGDGVPHERPARRRLHR